MTAVYARLRAEARDAGFAVLLMNLDDHDPVGHCVLGLRDGERPRNPTQFWQRALAKGVGLDAQPLPRFEASCFFDPRDM